MKKIYLFILASFSIIVSTAQTKHVLIEEYTGSWCGYCPGGNALVDTIMNNNPGMIFSIAYHSMPGVTGGEAMETPVSLQFADDYLVSAFPSAMIDRNPYQGDPVISNSAVWTPLATQALNHSTVVDVNISHAYNAATRLSDGTVDVTVYGAFSGKLFVNIMYTENNVVGVGNGYNQTNYYNNVPTSPFYGLGNPIIGYHHNRVFRVSLTDVYGDSTIIPMGVSTGTYSLPFSYVVDSNFNPAEMEIIAFVSRKQIIQTNQQSIIENVNSSPVLTFTGVEDHQTTTSITEIYPNPAHDNASISFLIKDNTSVKLELFNMLGSRVMNIADKHYTTGIFREYFNVSKLQPGVYFVKMIAGDKVISKKLIVE